jgi:hypothetical protein
MSIARHWKFETSKEPAFNRCSMNYLSVEKVGEGDARYVCYVEWQKNTNRLTIL